MAVAPWWEDEGISYAIPYENVFDLSACIIFYESLALKSATTVSLLSTSLMSVCII